MGEQPQVRRIEIHCVARPPVERVSRASGVGDVRIAGRVLRCTVTGSMQPLLESLAGTEVIDLRSDSSDHDHRSDGPPHPYPPVPGNGSTT